MVKNGPLETFEYLRADVKKVSVPCLGLFSVILVQ